MLNPNIYKKPFRIRLVVSGLILSGLLGLPAMAQEGGQQFKRKTVINFEDDTIEGDLKTPDGEYLQARGQLRHRSLIRIRTNFRAEVLGSIVDL